MGADIAAAGELSAATASAEGSKVVAGAGRFGFAAAGLGGVEED
jgi:hypothetical protein